MVSTRSTHLNDQAASSNLSRPTTASSTANPPLGEANTGETVGTHEQRDRGNVVVASTSTSLERTSTGNTMSTPSGNNRGDLSQSLTLPLSEINDSDDWTDIEDRNESLMDDEQSQSPDWDTRLQNLLDASKSAGKIPMGQWTAEISCLKHDVKSAVEAAQSSSQELKRIVFDIESRISRIKTQEERTAALIDLTRQGGLKHNHEKLISITTKCQLLLDKIAINFPSASWSSPPKLIPLLSRPSSSHMTHSVSTPTREPVDEGEYIIHLKAIQATATNPVTAFYSAMEKVRVQVKQAVPRGNDAKVTLRNLQDLELTTAALKAHRINGTPLQEVYAIETKISSKYTLSTDKFSKKRKLKLPFLVDGKIELNGAKTFLATRNPTIFQSETDVIGVELRMIEEDPKPLFRLKIHCSKRAHHLAMNAHGPNRRIDIHGMQLGYIDASRDEKCFKCHQTGHRIAQCPMELPNCKFCLARHESGKCKIRKNKALYECYKCREYNMTQNDTTKRRDENHAATDPQCLTSREQRAVAHRQKKARHVPDLDWW